MEPIQIFLDGINYTVLPMPDGSFEIFQTTEHLGGIMPIVENSTYIRWQPTENLDKALAQKIGEAIEAKENL